MADGLTAPQELLVGGTGIDLQYIGCVGSGDLRVAGYGIAAGVFGDGDGVTQLGGAGDVGSARRVEPGASQLIAQNTRCFCSDRNDDCAVTDSGQRIGDIELAIEGLQFGTGANGFTIVARDRGGAFAVFSGN